jgi:circadian clock protein KaiB
VGQFDATLAKFEQRLAELGPGEYVLTLFVTGASDLSGRAVTNVRTFCETHLAGRYHLEVVDVLRDQSRMVSRDVFAAPTLIKESPLPERRVVGDLSDTLRVLAALDIKQAAPAPPVVPR